VQFLCLRLHWQPKAYCIESVHVVMCVCLFVCLSVSPISKLNHSGMYGHVLTKLITINYYYGHITPITSNQIKSHSLATNQRKYWITQAKTIQLVSYGVRKVLKIHFPKKENKEKKENNNMRQQIQHSKHVDRGWRSHTDDRCELDSYWIKLTHILTI